MRTTLIIDDDVLHRAKRAASERSMTLSDLVTEALRRSMAQAPIEAPPFSMISYGDPTRPVHFEPEDFAGVLEREDAQRLAT